MADKENRRRSRLVDRQFQFRLAFRFLIAQTILFAGGILLVFLPSIYVLATTQDLKTLEPAAAELLVLHKRIWPAAALAFAGVFAYSLLISHRIAGPVYRINETLRLLLADEPVEQVKFREKDYFQPTAELLTELSRKLADRKTKP
ncbi:MAG: hypothetical protein IH577_04795 [Deltaproteobacteria bacterium]|nr:hypothetical protein [Deltaproteobacteria bacterium]